jgi:hypothetical protein
VDDIVLTFYCAAAEAEALALLLRGQSRQPVHVRDETVHGHDFADADMQEQVMGTLRRAAVMLEAPRAKADELIAAVASARRVQAVRWVMTPILARGRIA